MRIFKASLVIASVGFTLLCGAAYADGVDPACVGKHIMSDKPKIQADGTYMFEQGGYGNIATTLINRNQYSVINAVPKSNGKWCLAKIQINGTVNGNSFNSVVEVGAF